MSNVGPRINSLRLEKKLSLSALAERAEISKSLLHRIENHENSNPELGTLRKIAKALDLTVGELLGNEIVRNSRELPNVKPDWLNQLIGKLEIEGKKPDTDILEALYVLQNRKNPQNSTNDDWHYLYQTLERSFDK